MSKRGTLQAEYDALLAQTSGWEAETRKMLREHDEERKRGVEKRKAGLKELLKRKGEVHTALQQAIAEENAEVIAELALKPDAPAIQSAKPAEQLAEEKPAETLPADLKDETVAKEEQKSEESPAEQAQEKPAETPARPVTPPPAQQRQPNNGRGRHR